MNYLPLVLIIVTFLAVIYIIYSNITFSSTFNTKDNVFTPIIIPPPVYKSPPLFSNNKVYDNLSLASCTKSTNNTY